MVTFLSARCRVIGKPLDLIIIMDSSGSLRNSNSEEMNVIKDLINIVAVDPDATRISLVQFSGIARSEFHFNTFSSRKQVLDAIEVIKPIFGITKIGNALGEAVKELDVNKVLLYWYRVTTRQNNNVQVLNFLGNERKQRSESSFFGI